MAAARRRIVRKIAAMYDRWILQGTPISRAQKPLHWTFFGE
jgi:hypothetical protein